MFQWGRQAENRQVAAAVTDMDESSRDHLCGRRTHPRVGGWGDLGRSVVGKVSLAARHVDEDLKEGIEGATWMTLRVCSRWRKQHVPRPQVHVCLIS